MLTGVSSEEDPATIGHVLFGNTEVRAPRAVDEDLVDLDSEWAS